ncbi:erg28 like protein [Sarocladium implicatum]|nr:erg28 like protein [Sarocladium implicatum]
MEALRPYLPQGDGMLPYFMLVLSVTSIGNSIQTYKTLHFTRRVYNGLFVRNSKLPKPNDGRNPEDRTDKLIPVPQNEPKGTDQMTPLAARLFGTWTTVACLVRLYAAYNLHIGPMYDIAMWTYVIAFGHFASELFIYKSMTFGLPQFFPFLFASMALVWMPSVRSHYVQIA